MTERERDRAIVGMIVSLGHSLGLVVVAEGVETVDQLRHLRELGCDAAQGWLFSKAVPASTMAELLDRAGAPFGGDIHRVVEATFD